MDIRRDTGAIFCRFFLELVEEYSAGSISMKISEEIGAGERISDVIFALVYARKKEGERLIRVRRERPMYTGKEINRPRGPPPDASTLSHN
jgi:hypothetical protein